MSVVPLRREGATVLRPRGRSVTAALRPEGLATRERGPQGAPGRDGATFSGFGYQQVTELASEVGATLSPGQRVPLVMTVDSAQGSSTLQGPFAGFNFFDGVTLRARRIGDAMDLRLTATVTPSVAGGSMSVDCTINGSPQLTDVDSSQIFGAAGQPQRISFRLVLLPKAVFVANGAKLFLTSTVPLTVRAETLVILPRTAGP